MPIKSETVGEPPAAINVETPEGPFTAERDLSIESTGFHEVEVGNEVASSAELHDQTSSGAFDTPSGETVEVEAWKKGKAQTKVVAPPEDDTAADTSGAEGK